MVTVLILEDDPKQNQIVCTTLREKIGDCEDVETVTLHGLGYKAVIK